MFWNSIQRRRSLRKGQGRFLGEGLEPRRLLVADPIITELQASNDATVADTDGDFPDWIELHNPDVEAIDLSGWYLTDDANDLTKWQFPAGATLAPDGYQVVFASDKDRTLAGAELHTNFRLSSGGEFLALVKPDGETISQSFDPFPSLETDRSYGIAPGREVTHLVPRNGEAAILVPRDATDEVDWIQPGFNDADWNRGALGVGFEQLSSGFTEDFEISEAALQSDWNVDSPGAATVGVEGDALRLDVPTGLDTQAEDRGAAPIVWRDPPRFPDQPERVADSWEFVAHVTQRSEDRGAVGLMIVDGSTNLPVIKAQYRSRSRFELRVNEDRLDSVRESSEDSYYLRLVRDGRTNSWVMYFRLLETDSWTLVGRAVEGIDDVPAVTDPKLALFAVSGTSTMTADFREIKLDVADQQPNYAAFLSTDVGADMAQTGSSAYLRMPFQVEGDPSRFDSVTLDARFDDGFRAYLNGVLIAEDNVPLPPPAPAPDVLPWNAVAVGSQGGEGGRVPLNSFDLSNSKGLLREGENVLAVHGLNVATDDRDFFFDATLYAAELVPSRSQLFATPTPGQANAVPTAEPPVISGDEGAFFGSTTVEIELAEPSADFEIRYTTDGSQPSTDSRLYQGPIVLTESAMLQAATFDTSTENPLEPSPISTATFVAFDPSLRDVTSDVPIVVLDTLNGRLIPDASNSLTTSNVMAFEVNEATGRSSIVDGVIDYLGRGGIRDRGSSTSGQAKPNLTFETWGPSGTEEDDDFDVSLLGMPPESDWVLHAPFNFDRAMIRNQLTFALSKESGQWAPRTRAIEVYLNRFDGVVGESDYMGVYVLMEKIKRGPDRVDIEQVSRDDNTEPNVTGGYIFKIDRPDPDAPQFSAGGITLNWVYPKSPRSRSATDEQKATPEQEAWVSDHFAEVQATLRRADIYDPNGYSQFVDVQSWVDHHLVSVLMDDVDAFALSAYLFKDRDGKIEMGPVWDFDRSAESLDDRDDDPSLWGGSGGSNFFSRGWYTSVFRDPGFWQAYVDRWTELRQTVWSVENIDGWIDRLSGEIAEAQERNFAANVNRGVRPRQTSRYASGALDGTWQGEVEHLRTWLHERIAFIDSNFVQPPSIQVGDRDLPAVDPNTGLRIEGIAAEPNQSVVIHPPTLQFFNDTPFVDGDVGATTIRYFAPTDDTLGTEWTQPGFDDAAWDSGPGALGFEANPDDFVDLIQTVVRPAEGGTTVLTRIPFEVTDIDAAQSSNLFLRMKYDDGFVAYLNGQEIWQQNLRDDELAWNSRARSHRDSEAVLFEDFDVSEFVNLLVPGENVLAIRAINSSATSNDMLMLPALVQREVGFGKDPAGQVYYTTDGTDPKGPDGMPGPTALPFVAGQSLEFAQNTRLIARHFNDETNRGQEARQVRTDWSAPTSLNIQVEQPTLVITEINYDPPADVAPTEFVASDFEFVEIHNPTERAASLIGVRLDDGVEFDFGTSGAAELAAGESLVVVASAAAFASRYGDVSVAGEFEGSLDNGGENLRLVDGLGNTLFDVSYNDRDPWTMRAAGRGATLQLVQPAATELAQQSKWYSWSGSHAEFGDPGTASEVSSSPVVINEIVARTQGLNPLLDSIELVNRTDQPIDVGGWRLSDSPEALDRFVIPQGVVIAANGYEVFDQEAFGFGLDGIDGDQVWLTRIDAEGDLTFVDEVDFGPTLIGQSLGRVPDAIGRMAPLAASSLGQSNGPHAPSDVVISEIQYHPVLSESALAVAPDLRESDLEFVELENVSTSTVRLDGWRLRGTVDFEFSDLELEPNEPVVVLRFDPDQPGNAKRLEAFQTHYGLADDVTLVGGYSSTLDNSVGRVELQRPDSESLREPINVQVDEVLYDDQLPWPQAADGTGPSLQRVAADAYGNLAGSFVAADATPGQTSSRTAVDFDNDGQVTAADIDLFFEQLRRPDPDAAFDLNSDGTVDAADRDALVRENLGTVYGDANLDGVFDSQDFVQIFVRGGYNDGIELNSGWAAGDWNGDGDFDEADLELAFQDGGYRPG